MCNVVCFYGPFNCISFHKSSRQLSAFSLCSSCLISALLVVIYIMKVLPSPDIMRSGWLGSKHVNFMLAFSQILCMRDLWNCACRWSTLIFTPSYQSWWLTISISQGHRCVRQATLLDGFLWWILILSGSVFGFRRRRCFTLIWRVFKGHKWLSAQKDLQDRFLCAIFSTLHNDKLNLALHDFYTTTSFSLALVKF